MTLKLLNIATKPLYWIVSFLMNKDPDPKSFYGRILDFVTDIIVAFEDKYYPIGGKK